MALTTVSDESNASYFGDTRVGFDGVRLLGVGTGSSN